MDLLAHLLSQVRYPFKIQAMARTLLMNVVTVQTIVYVQVYQNFKRRINRQQSQLRTVIAMMTLKCLLNLMIEAAVMDPRATMHQRTPV